MTGMKRLIYGILGLMVSVTALAQTQSLEFHYITHDRTTPAAKLCEKLEMAYESAASDQNRAAIFYMPNYDRPLVVKVNLPEENRGDFKIIIKELRLKPSHEVYADVDYERILDIFNVHDFIDEQGGYNFTSVQINWYVNPVFWKYRYNEELISALSFDLEFNKYPDYVNTIIWHAEGDGLDVNYEYPFGTKNLIGGSRFEFVEY